MSTLVASLNLHIADRRQRRPAMAQRASHGELEDLNQSVLRIARGESKEIEFDRFFYAHFRDKLTLEVIDSENNTVVYPEVEGIFCLPTQGKVRISVDPLSTVSLERVVHLAYS